MVEQSDGGHPLIAQMEAQAAQQEQARLAELHRSLASAPPPQQHLPQGALPAPPGFVGQLAQYVYAQAIYPVPEVAIVAALGIMAGIAGREWTISNTGLNLYVALVARSGVGKEAMHTGISNLIAAAQPQCPMFGEAFDFSDFASGPALIKGLANVRCMVNVSGELGHNFARMAADNDPAMRSLRKVMTNLYAKSGPSSISGGLAYSNQENNIASLQSVAFSIIGESTPRKFYESLTPDMMEDGFMSRFCVIEYQGDRPDKNPAPVIAPPQPLIDQAIALVTQSVRLRMSNLFTTVMVNPDAQVVLDSFDAECDHNIRAAGDNEALRQIWSRANLKVLRVSGLLAVGENPYNPTVTVEQAQWAIGLIRWGNATFQKRVNEGDVGEGTDGGRETKVLELCREFLTLPTDKLPTWLKDGATMQQAGTVPRRYLQQRTQRLAAFEKHKLGHTAALNMAIKTAMTNGYLIEVKANRLLDMFGYNGQAYRIVHPN
jgi:hypothetical protein